jgi:hypothetical protein
MKQSTKNFKEKGFAMLFAVLVSSVLLSVGISIFNLTLKELILSSSGRESQFAFYAADTGAECALYWDFKASPPDILYATSSQSQTGNWRDPYIALINPSCVGTSLITGAATPITTTGTSAQTQFSITIPNTDANGNPAPYCAIITITKDSSSGIMYTTIDSRGYNTDCTSTDPIRVERAVRVSY